MDKIKNLSLRRTIVLYMIVSLMVSFVLSALIIRMATTIQDEIWWKYVDQGKYFEMAEGDGREYLTDVPRPNSYEMENRQCQNRQPGGPCTYGRNNRFGIQKNSQGNGLWAFINRNGIG